MTKSKKLLSVFLAVVMVLSSLMVGFYAIAADEGATEDTAVTDAETKISVFNDNKTYLFTTSNQEKHQAAVDAYDDATKAVKALTQEQKLQMNPDYYGFMLNYVAESVGRDNEQGTSTTAKIWATMSALDEIEEVYGELPDSYKEVYDLFTAFYGTQFGSDNLYLNAIKNFKDYDDAVSAYEVWAQAVSKFTKNQLTFSNYINLHNNGMYFYATKIGMDAKTLPNVINYKYNIEQDTTIESGANPANPSRDNFVKRSGSYSQGYTYEWVNNNNGATYLAAWQASFEAVKSEQLPLAKDVAEYVSGLFESSNPGLTEAVMAVIEVGADYFADKENPDDDSIIDAVNKVNALSSDARTIFNIIVSNSTLKHYAVLNIKVEMNENTSAQDAYSNAPSITTYTAEQMLNEMIDYVNLLYFQEFVDYVENLDITTLTDEQISQAKAYYTRLSAENKGNIEEDVFAKFVKIVSPVKDTNDFADEIAAFQPTAFVRPTNSKVAWTEGGIQNFVDMLESLLGGFVNLEEILSDNLYTADIVNMIFDLYATLSHNTTDIEGLITLGEVISAVITKDAIVSALPEAKFEKAVEKIKAAEVDAADPEGTNVLDKIAALELTAEDWGFTAGDKDGFIDALLAVIRPITQLLDPDAEIKITAMGMSIPATIGIRMFDYQITDDGNYTAGIYENLLPLLEQLGLNDLPTTEEYKANYYAVKESSGAAVAADEFLRPIIESLFKNIVDPVAENPVNGLVDILPRLAYVVDGDRLNTYIQKVLSDQGKVITLGGIAAMFAGDGPLLDLTTLGLDLSTKAINNMIPDSIDIGSLIGDGTELVLNIGDIPWSTLADCATLSVVPSKSIYNENVLLRTGDADSCFSTVFYWLFDVALADADTYNAIKGLIVGLVPDNLTTIINTVIAQVLDPIVAAGKVDGYGLLLDNVFIGAQPTGNEIWRVEAAAGQGGSISPSGTVAVKQADSQVFSVNANDGYTIASLTVNGQNIAAAKGAASYDYTVEGAKVTSADPANQNTTDVTIQVTFADESGKPAPGPEPTPDPDPSTPNENGGNNNSNSNNNNGGKLPVINNNNPNLPNTGAAEVAGMSVLTVIIALAAGAAVWFILKKRIVKE